MMKAVLVVSFGTSYPETREKNIDAIERDIAKAMPEARIYRAWTSGMIRKKVNERDKLGVDSVAQAMQRMRADGVDTLIVQPTHVVNGIENDAMIEDVRAHAQGFLEVKFGRPLLTYDRDYDEVIEAIGGDLQAEIAKKEHTAIVLMGHGTSHYANSAYAALDYKFKDLGYSNVFVGTVEAYPSLDAIFRRLRENHIQNILLTPFMIVAGDHANNDMAGDDENSWNMQFQKAGFQVECLIKGLGEYECVREIFVDHAREAV